MEKMQKPEEGISTPEEQVLQTRQDIGNVTHVDFSFMSKKTSQTTGEVLMADFKNQEEISTLLGELCRELGSIDQELRTGTGDIPSKNENPRVFRVINNSDSD